MLCSKMSLRRIAKVLRLNYKTVHRKMIFLGHKAKVFNQNYLSEQYQTKVTHLQFDDLITKEHTKLKPLSISIAVDVNTRRILGMQVSRIPAFGLLAKKARKKYGQRRSTHRRHLDSLLGEIVPFVDAHALIESDEHKLYPKLVQKHFAQARYRRFKGGSGCIVGQGELKKLRRDPLFTINQTLAMLRDNIARLIRKSWCLSKRAEFLQLHLDIYMKFHNTRLV